MCSLSVAVGEAVKAQMKAATLQRRSYSTEDGMYKTLEVTEPAQYVFKVKLNRPEKSNAMNRDFWR